MLYRHSHDFIGTFRAKLLLGLLGRAMHITCTIDKRLMAELLELPQRALISYVVQRDVITLTMQKQGDKFEQIILKPGTYVPDGSSNVIVRFNSPHDFFYILHHGVSIVQAISEGRLFIEGPAILANRYIRILSTTIMYLFPKKIAQRYVKRYEPPVRLYRKRCMLLLSIPFQRRRAIDVLQ